MARLSTRRRVLEVGSGKGVVAAEIAARAGRRVYGLDIRRCEAPPCGVVFVTGDAQVLPFQDATFDAVVFHFVLLWLRDPVAALKEAKRVLSPNGALLVLAEPDMTARRDEPDTGLKAALAEAVKRQGGRPDAGRQVGAWLQDAGLRPELRETAPSWVTIDDLDETITEVNYLAESRLIPRTVAEAITERERMAQGRRRVLLPLTYGVGWPA